MVAGVTSWPRGSLAGSGERRNKGVEKAHERAAKADMFLLLGRDVERVTDIGLVWNDREDQIVRITDDAELRDSRLTAWEEAFDLFETEETDEMAEPMRLCA